MEGFFCDLNLINKKDILLIINYLTYIYKN